MKNDQKRRTLGLLQLGLIMGEELIRVVGRQVQDREDGHSEGAERSLLD